MSYASRAAALLAAALLAVVCVTSVSAKDKFEVLGRVSGQAKLQLVALLSADSLGQVAFLPQPGGDASLVETIVSKLLTEQNVAIIPSSVVAAASEQATSLEQVARAIGATWFVTADLAGLNGVHLAVLDTCGRVAYHEFIGGSDLAQRIPVLFGKPLVIPLTGRVVLPAGAPFLAEARSLYDAKQFDALIDLLKAQIPLLKKREDAVILYSSIAALYFVRPDLDEAFQYAVQESTTYVDFINRKERSWNWEPILFGTASLGAEQDLLVPGKVRAVQSKLDRYKGMTQGVRWRQDEGRPRLLINSAGVGHDLKACELKQVDWLGHAIDCLWRTNDAYDLRPRLKLAATAARALTPPPGLDPSNAYWVQLEFDGFLRDSLRIRHPDGHESVGGMVYGLSVQSKVLTAIGGRFVSAFQRFDTRPIMATGAGVLWTDLRDQAIGAAREELCDLVSDLKQVGSGKK